jgi:hypothetical protein
MVAAGGAALAACGNCFLAKVLNKCKDAVCNRMPNMPSRATLKKIAKWSGIGLPTLVYAWRLIHAAFLASANGLSPWLIAKYVTIWTGIPIGVVAVLVVAYTLSARQQEFKPSEIMII